MPGGGKLAHVAIGDYVTIVNAYGREVRGRVAIVHSNYCTILAGDKQVAMRADESNTVNVSRVLQEGAQANKSSRWNEGQR
jgi:hypothetical protein